MKKTFRLRVRPQGVAMAVVLTGLVVYALWQRSGFVLFIAAALLVLVLDGLMHGACVVDEASLRVHTHRFRADTVVPLEEVAAVEQWRGCAVVHRHSGKPLVLCPSDREGFCAWMEKRMQAIGPDNDEEDDDAE